MRPIALPVLLLACNPPVAEDTDPCANSLPAGTVEVFATGFDRDVDGTEGLTFGPDGRLYVGGSGLSGDGYVAEIQTDGTWEILVDIPGSVGLAWWGDRLMVASSDDGAGAAALYSVDPGAGTAELFAGGLPGSNFPTVTPWNTLLLSSPGGTVIWEFEADGSWSEWATGVPAPNGMALSLDGTELYVANTYGTPSTVTRIQVTDGRSGEVTVLATLPDGSTQDGVAMDAAGNLYVVNNLPGTIARISPDGEVTTVAEGVNFGASLAFGEGPFDACSVYVSSLFSTDVFRVGVGAQGLPPAR